MVNRDLQLREVETHPLTSRPRVTQLSHERSEHSTTVVALPTRPRRSRNDSILGRGIWF